MRDAVILAFLVAAVPVCLFSPFFGILMWFFISIVTPHRYAWGLAYNFPAAAAVAVPTVIGVLFKRKLNRGFLRTESVLLLVLWLWFLTTMLHARMVPEFSYHLANGWERLVENSKILFMTVLTMLIVNTPDRLRKLYLVTGGSLALLAFKGALFAVATGGMYRIYGTRNSFIADNNDFALAMNMALPMLFYLSRAEGRRWLRWLLKFGFYAGIMVVILTYSRGGFLGLCVVMGGLAIKANRKLISVTLLITAILLVFPFLPERWINRMDGLIHGRVDRSADQRLVSWGYAWNLAKHYPITGGGFEAFSPELFAKYQLRPLPGGFKSSGPHSIYFQVMAEQGFVGLGLYLTLVLCCVFSLRKTRRRAQHNRQTEWLVPYTHISELSLYAFFGSGAFLGRAYFDLFFQIVACTVILKILYREQSRELEEREAEQTPFVESELAGVTA